MRFVTSLYLDSREMVVVVVGDDNGTLMAYGLDPGQSVVLTFQVPQDSAEFQPLYDLFWCNVHGKQHADTMRGEILIVETRGETGGG